MKSRLLIGLALVAMFALAACGDDSGSNVPSATLRVHGGTVEVSFDDVTFAAATEGQVLTEGATVRTGADGRAAIEYFDGSVTRLDHGTTFKIVTMQILDNDAQSKVIEGEQVSGNTYNRVTELTDAASRFDIETPTATASVQGTVYAVLLNADGSTTVAVIEGFVDAGDGPVPAGFMVTVDEDGNVSDPIPIPDDLIDDEWIVYNCELDEGPECPDEGTTTTTVAGPDTTVTTVPPTTTTTEATTTTTTVAPPPVTTTTVPATTTTTVPPTTTTTTVPATTTTTLPPTTTTTVPPTTTTTTAPVFGYIVISPQDSTIAAGDTQAYTAEAFDTNDQSMGDVTEGTVFTISGEASCEGNECGSEAAGQYTVTGTYLGDEDSTGLTVNPGPLASIEITPSAVTVEPDVQVTYTAEGWDAFGNSHGAVAAAYDIVDGVCSGNACSATTPGNHTVTGSVGQVSDTAVLTVEELGLGTGDVEVFLRWTGDADIDLWVTDPGGVTVKYSNPNPPTGGHLDADIVPGCNPSTPDEVHTEHIFWDAGEAPEGTYTATAHVFTYCDVEVPYSMTIIVNGSLAYVIDGTFTADNQTRTQAFPVPTPE